VVDPRREHYERAKVFERLRAYGRTLGMIHSLPIDWCTQGRQHLENLIGEENLQDGRFEELVRWLRMNEPQSRNQAFVHGDFNTANVLIDDCAVSGVLDWEFAGRGWREYDLAWALRSRITFFNSDKERSAILSGYGSTASYDMGQLKWCEILNSLHFASWSADKAPEYTSFALARARERLCS
jgi:aminoglycoside phosphotransferase (APT) family kinase protein